MDTLRDKVAASTGAAHARSPATSFRAHNGCDGETPSDERTYMLTLDPALEETRTGDLWLFRGRSRPDRAIQALTNAPVNHVGMTVAIDDLPPLIWHAELGDKLVDVWTGTNHRGVQLNDLRQAVLQWTDRYQ